ncbi:MAG: NAD(P)/FAD-dependent oxidoreductase, partial [Firmicutes bacterium]|nr:NAD(P)/FAD-dependent oxidoreductase [Bacillota bacterium]
MYDVIVIGGGLSGLAAGSLLAKRGLKVIVIDKSAHPGGSSGSFKRNGVTFDNGAAMLYGFGEKGYNSHRFVFNCLEEPIDIIKHDYLYCINYRGFRIKFYQDIDKFIEELRQLFPDDIDNFRHFYHDIGLIYQHVMVEDPSFSTPDETDKKKAFSQMKKHPLSYFKFLTYLNMSTETLLKKYFKNPEIFKFFNKLTSTYCYTTVKETPAVLAAVMFVDNHTGGSYYPAGSTMFLTGKLEKAIEEHGGDMLPNTEVTKILFEDNKPVGVETNAHQQIFAKDIVYSGTVWNFYEKLVAPENTTKKKIAWAKHLVPTYPSVVLYALVDKKVIPADTLPIEMLVGNPDNIDENEVTCYILSIDDRTLCPDNYQTLLAIGPSLVSWKTTDPAEYQRLKDVEKTRLLDVLEKRFPGFKKAVKFTEVASPRTIERFANKNGGAVAGPLQKLGQHMFKRWHTRSEWDNLFYCGESTAMGTGTPTVTISGLTAANTILRKYGYEPFVYDKNQKNYVR